jgi:hypothetical protein
MTKESSNPRYHELRAAHPWLHWGYYIRRRLSSKFGVPLDAIPEPGRLELWAVMVPACEVCGVLYEQKGKQGPHPRARILVPHKEKEKWDFSMMCAKCAGTVQGRPRKYQR